MSIEAARSAERALESGGPARRPVLPRLRTPLWSDLSEGLGRWRLWSNLAWKDIRGRYRRTVIGPFWTALSTALLVGSLGFVNATLWHMKISDYLPFFCAGYISWLLFTTIINESGTSLTSADATLKAIRVPYSVFILRLLCRNLIVFGHNLAVFIVVAAIFGITPNRNTLLLPVGLVLAALNYLWIGLLLSAICARFRDVLQLITNLTMILFFVTPIFWQPAQLGSVPIAKFLLADANFVYHIVDVIRAPLLGQAPASLSFLYLSASAVLGLAGTALFLRRFYDRIAYWL